MNELRAYLNALAPTEQAQFALRCGTSIGYLRKALSTGQVLREKLCALMERDSSGRVTRMGLRPQDWQDIWPELASPAQAATEVIANPQGAA